MLYRADEEKFVHGRAISGILNIAEQCLEKSSKARVGQEWL